MSSLCSSPQGRDGRTVARQCCLVRALLREQKVRFLLLDLKGRAQFGDLALERLAPAGEFALAPLHLLAASRGRGLLTGGLGEAGGAGQHAFRADVGLDQARCRRQ